MEKFADILSNWFPSLIVLAISLPTLILLRFFFFKRKQVVTGEHQLSRQLTMFVFTAVFVVTFIVFLPISESLRAEFLSLLGILVTAAIALSSTTFVGNAMAGLMLRAVENFRPGDFVRVGEHFGRVSERGFLHTEIQTEDSDLTTLPNLFLVANPVKVVRSSGTIISAHVSLGYDVSHTQVMALLKQAAEASELTDCFVHVVELGDFSISYRVAGFLSEIKTLISAKSRLRESILQTLHANGVEIVSPRFVNQRQLEQDQRFIPRNIGKSAEPSDEGSVESVIFDKADEAESQDAQQKD